mmetsp:Transcript_15555/g.48972  ORF Transcript_15555/g.48972 Transcript_15555/m.48972 type:complete len:327 (-) Transcript_15555:36-1016(-)
MQSRGHPHGGVWHRPPDPRAPARVPLLVLLAGLLPPGYALQAIRGAEDRTGSRGGCADRRQVGVLRGLLVHHLAPPLAVDAELPYGRLGLRSGHRLYVLHGLRRALGRGHRLAGSALRGQGRRRAPELGGAAGAAVLWPEGRHVHGHRPGLRVGAALRPRHLQAFHVPRRGRGRCRREAGCGLGHARGAAQDGIKDPQDQHPEPLREEALPPRDLVQPLAQLRGEWRPQHDGRRPHGDALRRRLHRSQRRGPRLRGLLPGQQRGHRGSEAPGLPEGAGAGALPAKAVLHVRHHCRQRCLRRHMRQNIPLHWLLLLLGGRHAAPHLV